MGDQVVVDNTGRRQATFPSALFSGDVEIERPDLARILHRHSVDVAEYVFGDHVIGLTETAHGVTVTFADGPTRQFDLVVGADGPHSAVRGLAFGDERGFRHDLGLCIAGFTMPNGFGIDHSGLIYNEPNRMVMVSSGRDSALAAVGLLFATDEPDYDRHDVEDQKRVLAEHFADLGWQVPAVLDALRDTRELYFDTISQIRLDRWSNGRIVLLGDAAWCTGPGGNGTGHAMLGAYTLAGELALAGGDHRTAYERYERIMRPAVARSQRTAAGAGTFLTPATQRKIRNRNLMFRFLSLPALAGVFGLLARRTANTGALRDYPLPHRSASPSV
jgi:2-polyprenyl-6-methoxyphenol hydroxylase-like FAD-dependent oxidoreductase